MDVTSVVFVKGVKGSDEIFADGIPQIAFIGRSNVGKSSMLNALAGRPIARVGTKPGKTSEINFFLVNKSLYFVDLPGYGFSLGGAKDREKLRRHILWYFTSGEAKPRTVVLILEAKAGLTKFDEQMIEVLKEHQHPYIIVLNKIDKLTQKEASAQMEKIRATIGSVEISQTSVETGRGIDAVRTAVFA